MSDNESDEDLRRAIALSLEHVTPTSARGDIIDLISSDEDDDLDATVNARQNCTVLENRLKPSQKKNESDGRGDDGNSAWQRSPSSSIQLPSVIAASTVAKTHPAGSFLQGLDRKIMEEERLARVRESESTGYREARKRSAPISPETSARKAPKTSYGTEENVTRKQDNKEGQPLVSRPSNYPNGGVVSEPRIASYQEQKQLGSSGIQFPQGTVRKTWAYGYPRLDDIKIEEVLQKNDLELAVLSAYQVDSDWIINKLDASTKVVWVLQAKEQSQVSINILPRISGTDAHGALLALF